MLTNAKVDENFYKNQFKISVFTLMSFSSFLHHVKFAKFCQQVLKLSFYFYFILEPVHYNVFSCLCHAFRHWAARKFTQEALEVLEKFLESADAAADLQRSSINQGRLVNHFLSDQGLGACNILQAELIEYHFKLWIFCGQLLQSFFLLASLRNSKHHVQHFFVEGASAFECRPEAILKRNILFHEGILGRQGDDFFDESDKVLLEVVEYGLFAGGIESFVAGRVNGMILGQLGAVEVVRFLDRLGW